MGGPALFPCNRIDKLINGNGSMNFVENVRQGYDQVAEHYAERFINELDHKPGDRALLDRFVGLTRGKGKVCDIGTGPGQVAAYLYSRGLDVFGIDLSLRMVAQAIKAHPQITFRQGDMRHLDLTDNSLAGITAFYCIIHIPRAEVTAVLRELRRVLQPGGILLLSFHEGNEIRHFDEWWDKTVSLDFTFFWRDEMRGYLRDTEYEVLEIVDRDADPEHEIETHRVYMFASKPAA
jgi:ubiquinone/menaquinone biosynthesis C-methylase UbiE